MIHLKQYILLLTLILIGCKDNSISSGNGTTSGRTTLTTKLVNDRAVGFSFAKGDTVVLSTSMEIIPDIELLVQRNDTAKVIGVFLSPYPFREAFRLITCSTNADSARESFMNFKEFSDSAYSDLALPVSSNQVWVVKTHDNKYAKILIISTQTYDDNSIPSMPTEYGEVIFDWVYNPSGERKF